MKIINVTLEVYDQTTLEDIEKSVDKAMNDSSIDCTYHVEEKDMTNKIHEELKSAIWDNGVEAIDDLLGYEHDVEEDKDVIENRMDAVLEQMPEEEVLAFYHKYCKGQVAKNVPPEKQWTADMIEQVEKLHNNTPEGQIVDADTILVDLVQNCDHEFTGFAQDIFNIWKESSDKKAVEQMFYEFTDMEFDRFLMTCDEKITRKPVGLGEKIQEASTRTGDSMKHESRGGREAERG